MLGNLAKYFKSFQAFLIGIIFQQCYLVLHLLRLIKAYSVSLEGLLRNCLDIFHAPSSVNLFKFIEECFVSNFRRGFNKTKIRLLWRYILFFWKHFNLKPRDHYLQNNHNDTKCIIGLLFCFSAVLNCVTALFSVQKNPKQKHKT